METKQNLGFLQIVGFIFSFYVLIVLVLETFLRFSPEVSRLLVYIDSVICSFFFVDFCLSFKEAKNKKEFLKWGWVDLISCIPTIEVLRLGRLFKLVKLIRIFRAFKTSQSLVNHFFKNKAKGALGGVSILALILVLFSSIAILQVETSPNSNIKTAEDAIWWAYATITTVGYGDKFPVTTEGRMIACLLMTAGVGMFGTFTAYVASWFAIKEKN